MLSNRLSTMVCACMVLSLLLTIVAGSTTNQCKQDNCFNDLSQGSADCKARAKRDCSSFLLTTVIPCPTTTTGVCPGAKKTVTSTVTSISTALVVSTSQVSATTTVSTTSTAIVTSYSTSFVFLYNGTITTPTSSAVKTSSTNAQKRAVSTTSCSDKTSTCTSVPTYATCCGNASAYSSACKCLGISGTVTTLPRQTATSCTTGTVTSTSNVISITRVSSTEVVTATQTQTSSYTETSTQVVTQTVTACPIFVTGGDANFVVLGTGEFSPLFRILGFDGSSYFFIATNSSLEYVPFQQGASAQAVGEIYGPRSPTSLDSTELIYCNTNTTSSQIVCSDSGGSRGFSEDPYPKYLFLNDADSSEYSVTLRFLC